MTKIDVRLGSSLEVLSFGERERFWLYTTLLSGVAPDAPDAVRKKSTDVRGQRAAVSNQSATVSGVAADTTDAAATLTAVSNQSTIDAFNASERRAVGDIAGDATAAAIDVSDTSAAVIVGTADATAVTAVTAVTDIATAATDVAGARPKTAVTADTRHNIDTAADRKMSNAATTNIATGGLLALGDNEEIPVSSEIIKTTEALNTTKGTSEKPKGRGYEPGRVGLGLSPDRWTTFDEDKEEEDIEEAVKEENEKKDKKEEDKIEDGRKEKTLSSSPSPPSSSSSYASPSVMMKSILKGHDLKLRLSSSRPVSKDSFSKITRSDPQTGQKGPHLDPKDLVAGQNVGLDEGFEGGEGGGGWQYVSPIVVDPLTGRPLLSPSKGLTGHRMLVAKRLLGFEVYRRTWTIFIPHTPLTPLITHIPTPVIPTPVMTRMAKIGTGTGSDTGSAIVTATTANNSDYDAAASASVLTSVTVPATAPTTAPAVTGVAAVTATTTDAVLSLSPTAEVASLPSW